MFSIYTMFGCSYAKGKERKWGREGKEKRKYFLLMCLNEGKKEKKKMLEFYLFFVWFAKGKMCVFTFVPLLIMRKFIYYNTYNL